jgi:hypothetical protein
VPSRAIHQQHGLCARRNPARDFVNVQLHGPGVGDRKREGRAGSARRTNRAEEIGVFVALVGGLAWPGSAPRPLANNAVLLADARFILEPDFDWLVGWHGFEMGVQRVFEVFLNASIISTF